MTVITAVIVLPLTTTTLFISGAGPEPFSKVKLAPLTKPDPVIVTEAVVPVDCVLGLMAVTVTPTGVLVGVGGTEVLVGVGGIGVLVGVGGMGVLVGVLVGNGVLVAVGGMGVLVGVGGMGVLVGVFVGKGVLVGVGGMGVLVGVGVGPVLITAVIRTSSIAASTKLPPAASAASINR